MTAKPKMQEKITMEVMNTENRYSHMLNAKLILFAIIWAWSNSFSEDPNSVVVGDKVVFPNAPRLVTAIPEF